MRASLGKHGMFAQPKDEAEDPAHKKRKKKEQPDDPRELTEQVSEPWNRLGKNIVNCPLLEIL